MEICMTCEKANDFEKMSIQSASMPLDPYSSAPDDEDDDFEGDFGDLDDDDFDDGEEIDDDLDDSDDEDDDFDFTYSSDEDDDLEGDEEDDDDDEDETQNEESYIEEGYEGYDKQPKENAYSLKNTLKAYANL